MIFYVHIGKTGGTAIKHQIRAHFDVPKRKEPQVIDDKFVLLDHTALGEAVKTFGTPTGLAFSYREPSARFVSGFYCRQRMGYPEHTARWDALEAAAFAHFDSANDMAEALNSPDLAKRAAAHYAMFAIRHIRRGYRFHFGKLVDFMLDFAPSVVACIDTAHLNTKGGAFLDKLGVAPQAPAPRQTVPYPQELSDLARRNLQDVWAEEYDFYEAFQRLEADVL